MRAYRDRHDTWRGDAVARVDALETKRLDADGEIVWS
jgi:hypothetical protein